MTVHTYLPDPGLSTPVARMEWMTAAACLQYDPETWHPDGKHSNVAAKRICAGCPVQQECATYALESDEPLTGIWGGLTAHQRARLRGTQGYLTGTYQPPREPWTCSECGASGPANIDRHRAKTHSRRTA